MYSAQNDNVVTFKFGFHVILGTALAVLLIAGCGGWAATTLLNGAIIAQGSVKVDRNLKSLQHRDGGIVSEIAVREGDVVQEGQILIRLDDVQTRAELSIVRSQLAELVVRKARLLAERDGLDHIEFPDDIERTGREIEQIISGETRLFKGNLQKRTSQQGQLELTVSQIGEEIRGLQAQRESKSEETLLVEAEYQKIKGLADKKLIEGSKLYIIEREVARLRGEHGGIEASIARAKVRTSEVKLQIIAIGDNAQTDAQKELSALETRVAELRDRRLALEDRLARTDIRAPISGIVNELSVHTIGGVITPAEKVATIVPIGALLKIETRLLPTDIDQVAIGRSAKLKFSSFNQRTTPELVGAVRYLSAATIRDVTNGQMFYIGDIEVAEAELDKLGSRNRLLPGMPVEVHIATDERTALSYLLRPLTDQFTRAFRER